MYYLYVKTHLKTGLKYLGFTKQNPYTYKGSGKYWKRHIKKYGYDIWTNIIFQSEIEYEIKQNGLYFSELWNIVESKEWANLKPEQGDGGFYFTKEELSNFSKNKWINPITREKIINGLIKASNNPEIKKLRSSITTNYFSKPENREYNKLKQIIVQNKPEVKKSKSIGQKLAWEKTFDNMMKSRNTLEYKEKLSIRNKEIQNRPDIKEIKSKKAKKRWQDPEFLKENTFHCSYCDKNIIGKGQWVKHLNSKTHKKM